MKRTTQTESRFDDVLDRAAFALDYAAKLAALRIGPERATYGNEPEPPTADEMRELAAQLRAGAPELLDVAGACALLGISRPSLYNYVKAGKIQAYQVGGEGKFKFRRADLLASLTPARDVSQAE